LLVIFGADHSDILLSNAGAGTNLASYTASQLRGPQHDDKQKFIKVSRHASQLLYSTEWRSSTLLSLHTCFNLDLL